MNVATIPRGDSVEQAVACEEDRILMAARGYKAKAVVGR